MIVGERWDMVNHDTSRDLSGPDSLVPRLAFSEENQYQWLDFPDSPYPSPSTI